ncbi:hypothetical protein LINPERHAP1_LOCUS12311 [Linum perenne]
MEDSFVLEFKGFSTLQQGKAVYSQSFEVGGYQWMLKLNPSKTSASFVRPTLKLIPGDDVEMGLHLCVNFDLTFLGGTDPRTFAIFDLKFHKTRLKKKVAVYVTADHLVNGGFIVDDTLKVELRNFRVSRPHAKFAAGQFSEQLVEESEILSKLFDMSVESIHEENEWGVFERILHKIAGLLNNDVRQTAIWDILNQVKEFKRDIPSCLDSINISDIDRSTSAAIKESLTGKRRWITDLETGISEINGKKAKLGKDLKDLVSSRDKLNNTGKSKAVVLSSLQKQVSKESEQLKKNKDECFLVRFNMIKARTELKVYNVYWKEFQLLLEAAVEDISTTP